MLFVLGVMLEELVQAAVLACCCIETSLQPLDLQTWRVLSGPMRGERNVLGSLDKCGQEVVYAAVLTAMEVLHSRHDTFLVSCMNSCLLRASSAR